MTFVCGAGEVYMRTRRRLGVEVLERVCKWPLVAGCCPLFVHLGPRWRILRHARQAGAACPRRLRWM